MSIEKEETLFVLMGVRYEEQDGLLYPIFAKSDTKEPIHVGKYGDLWMEYLKESHPDRYHHLFRWKKLMEKAAEVEEEAYQILDSITEKFLMSHSTKDSSSTIEMWSLREEAKRMAEEVIFQDIVNQYH